MILVRSKNGKGVLWLVSFLSSTCSTKRRPTTDRRPKDYLQVTHAISAAGVDGAYGMRI